MTWHTRWPQVEAWEAAAHPGVAAEAPESSREFLETEASASPPVEGAGDAGGQPVGGAPAGATAPDGGDGGGDLGADGGVGGERLVIYPARNGHASYHMPKRYLYIYIYIYMN